MLNAIDIQAIHTLQTHTITELCTRMTTLNKNTTAGKSLHTGFL